MTKYIVAVPFSGYVRGYKRYEVEADTPAEAIEQARDVWYSDANCIVRDDTETDWEDAEVTND
ncbi:hypothetical protein HOU73_gp26 [Pectobacterium phage Koot]|uniref:Uncharacterized protein n=3 Tax=Phimunavirus koot TaxID=2733341 RepID=A0A3G8FIM6_9CAUD|nr:hypothetical protein HOU73_gp26 [Pectobacterium phage Koot]AXY81900.1 hypothetical protein [Pectobacterium phage Momine]AZF94612.1 hypothetical protein [Pectobacterium phage Koot]AZF94664.1 hypothetical protein [Pectobacterium phage Koot_B1]